MQRCDARQEHFLPSLLMLKVILAVRCWFLTDPEAA